MDLLWYRVSLRLSCAVAFSSWAWATSTFACAWVRLLRGIRGSILASSWPFWTSSPVWTGIARISPEAFDFTLKVRIGWIAPEAVAVTTMSRRATGTSEYGGADCTFWHAAAPASTTALTTLSCRLTAGRLCPLRLLRRLRLLLLPRHPPAGTGFAAAAAPPARRESTARGPCVSGRPPVPARQSRPGGA